MSGCRADRGASAPRAHEAKCLIYLRVGSRASDARYDSRYRCSRTHARMPAPHIPQPPGVVSMICTRHKQNSDASSEICRSSESLFAALLPERAVLLDWKHPYGTDDRHIDVHATRWGIHITRPTHGPIVSERTAAVVWDVLAHVRSPAFLWNVFPLHLHEPSDPFSNRAHNATERAVGQDRLTALIDLLRPRRLIAIGNDSAKARWHFGHLLEQLARATQPNVGGA